jgi:hypothetical protein
MATRIYRKPELKSRKVEFGVFGDYSDNGGPRNKPATDPVGVISKFDMHLE